MAKKRKKPIKRYAIIALLALLFVWPVERAVAVDVPACTRASAAFQVDIVNVAGEAHLVKQFACSEGGVLIVVNGREFARDVAPEDVCQGFWYDAGMVDEQRNPMSMARWSEPDWQFRASPFPGCPEPASLGGC